MTKIQKIGVGIVCDKAHELVQEFMVDNMQDKRA
jgi:hypothetical protein